MIDSTTILAELAAIQRDVRTLAESASIYRYSSTVTHLGEQTCARLAALMSSIAAPSPVEVDPAEAAERTKHWPACGRRRRTDARCVCDRDHDSRYAVGLPPVSAESEAMVSRLMAANTPAATTSRKLEPVDNGMLAPIRARLDRMEREIAKLDERIERDRFDLDRRVMKLEARIDGGDPGDEQEAS